MKLFLSERHLSCKDRIERVRVDPLSSIKIYIGIGVPGMKDTEQIRDKRGVRR